MSLKKTIKKYKDYSKMSNLGEIVRRKFFNNCFDGALTCAGIVSGIFILFLANPSLFVPQNVVITGFATALAIGISGLWGAFLSEEAERKKKMVDLKKEMVIFKQKDEKEKNNKDEKEKNNEDEKEKNNKDNILEEKEIQKAIITPLKFNHLKILKSLI